MAKKRIKKPSVPVDLRREWLRRHEEFGDSYLKIAKDDGYDQRTVKQHVLKGQQERDQNQARIQFVKENIEKHHQDLCYRAEEILALVTGEKTIVMDFTEDLYLNGLRQHLNRSLLWNKIQDWNDTLNTLEPLYVKAKTKIERVLKRTKLYNIQSDPPEAVINGAIAALLHQFREWTRGNSGMDFENDWHIEERKEGRLKILYGSSHFGWIQETDFDKVKKMIKSDEKRLRKWPEYSEVENIVNTMKKLQHDLRNELRGIIIRRVLPGKCFYCPL